jgi:hypothetical protein
MFGVGCPQRACTVQRQGAVDNAGAPKQLQLEPQGAETLQVEEAPEFQYQLASQEQGHADRRSKQQRGLKGFMERTHNLNAWKASESQSG